MAYRIELTPRARRDFLGLGPEARKRVAKTIDLLAESPRPAGARKLSAREDTYRVRSGSNRILYAVEDAEARVLVLRIAHRRDVYRRA